MFAKRLRRALNYTSWIKLQKPPVKCISTYNNSNNNNNNTDLLSNNGRCFVPYLNKRQKHTSTPMSFASPVENTYARQVLGNSKVYSKTLATQLSLKEELTIDKIEDSLQQSWISMSNSDLLDNFELLSHYANKNQENINDVQYRGVMEVLTSRCPAFTDEELIHLLKCLELWNLKPVDIYYKGLWRVLDEECLERLPKWNINQIFLINDCFYRISLHKYSRFPIQSLKNINPSRMTAANLVQYAFLLKANRRLNIYLQDMEHLFVKHADEFSLEEMGIVAMAYFKYETQLRNKNLIMKFMQKLLANLKTVDNITLAAILKALRYNIDLTTVHQYDILLRSLIHQVPRLSIQVLTHIAHMQSRTLLQNRELISRILDKYERELELARAKDIERIVFTLYVFNYNPETTPFYSSAIKELMDSHRNLEINRFPKSLVYTVMYMMQVNFYPEEALKYIMTPKFIHEISKGDINEMDREYLILDYCIEIDQPEYDGPRIRKDVLNYLVKKFGVLQKKERRKYEKVDQAERLLIDVSHSCKIALGDESLIHIDSFLPHLSKSDIVVCYDPSTEKFLPPAKKISEMPVGTIKYAPKDGLKWCILVISAHNSLMRNTFEPTGSLAVYLRHLEKIGYTPLVIRYDVWQHLRDKDEKQTYLKDLLSFP